MSKIIKATYIDEGDIPPPMRRRTDWESIFSNIPEGKVRVIASDEAHYTTVMQALKRFKEK